MLLRAIWLLEAAAVPCFVVLPWSSDAHGLDRRRMVARPVSGLLSLGKTRDTDEIERQPNASGAYDEIICSYSSWKAISYYLYKFLYVARKHNCCTSSSTSESMIVETHESPWSILLIQSAAIEASRNVLWYTPACQKQRKNTSWLHYLNQTTPL